MSDLDFGTECRMRVTICDACGDEIEPELLSCRVTVGPQTYDACETCAGRWRAWLRGSWADFAGWAEWWRGRTGEA